MSFLKFHFAYWLLAGSALFISGWSQSNVPVSLTRNVYFTLAGLGFTFLLVKAWQKITAEKFRSSLLGFLAASYFLGMALTVPINPVTYGQLGIAFDDLTLRHFFAGSMNFGFVVLLWAVLFFFFFKRDFRLPAAITSRLPQSENLAGSGTSMEVEEKGRTILVPLNEISHLKAAADYVEIHLMIGQSHLKRATIQSLQNRLKPEGFIQVHRSIVINQNALAGVEGSSKGSYTLVMNTGTRLQTARRYKPAVEAMLANAGFSPS